MRPLLPLLTRSPVGIASLVSSAALVLTIAACADSPDDGDLVGGPGTASSPTEPQGESQTLPPSNPPAKPAPAKDAGTTSSTDSGKSSTSSSGGGSSSGGSSGTSTSSSGGAAASCDIKNPLNLVKALSELGKPTPRTCGAAGGSCAANECCFDLYGVCIDQ